MRITSLAILLAISSILMAQNSANDPQAAALLQKVSNKYKQYKSINTQFKLLVMKPKMRPEDDDRKYTDTITGSIVLSGTKFRVDVNAQKIFCDGKNIWTYIPSDKEAQVNTYEESDDIFSPSKIFSMYKEGYMYQIKERRTVNGKSQTVVELAPVNKKVSYFKIDVAVDDESSQIVESKIYEKNGVRYIYKLSKQTFDGSFSDGEFTFDAKKYPGVKLVDLR